MGLSRNVTAASSRSAAGAAVQCSCVSGPTHGEAAPPGRTGLPSRSISEPRGSAEAWEFLLQLSQGPRELGLRLRL